MKCWSYGSGRGDRDEGAEERDKEAGAMKVVTGSIQPPVVRVRWATGERTPVCTTDYCQPSRGI